ncbi:MAG: histidine kinase, partial [Chitinophagaceae bacterium]
HIRNGQVFYFATTGIYRLDPQKRLLEAEVLLPDKYWEWGSYVIQDVENNFWIGTHEKLLHARKRLFSAVIQPELPGFDEVYSMREMKNGDLLVGGNHGMLFRKANGGELFSFTGKIFDRAQISDMIEDEDGNTWFGSGFQGIAVKSKTGKAIFTKKQGLRDNTNLFLLYTKDKQLYAAGDNGISKIIINPQEQQPAFKNWLSNSGSNNYAVFKTGIEKPGGGFLFGSSYGLFEIVRDSLRSIHIEDAPRKNHFITNISLDKKNNAWISTIGDGILVCRFTNTGSLKLIRQLTEADGLSSMLYLSMIIDKDDVIWAISYSGLTRIEKAGGMDFGVINFSLVHGFVNDNYHSAKMLQAKNGLIWIGTSSGLFNFHPGNALQFIGTSPVYLTQVSYGKGNKTSVYQPAQSGLEKPSKLELSYNINDISFDFNSINLSEPLSTIYKFRLLGLDSTWTDAGKNRTANFRNLRPGSYLFEVKASNGTNKWSKIESFAYVINPPFWNTWWFVAATVVLVCMLIFYLLKKRERMIKKGDGEKMEIQKLKTISYQYQLEIEQVINYFATSISEQKTVDDILWDVARNCISKLGFEDCVIYLIDLDRNILIQKAAWGPKTTEENKILYPIEIPLGHGIVGTVAETGKALIISDTSADPRYIIDDARRLSEITVPILNEGKVLGVIDSEYPEKNFYTSRHLHILTTIASLCAEKMAKVKSAHQAMEKEVEFFKLNQDLAASQLTALRSQMNPHFIFNSLNSIAQLVASKKNDEGLEYLNKFSKLMRLVLDESGNNLITLKDEKRMLDLYLQLESLRFGSSFSHSIHISEELDEEDTLLPSFIIHPIVENAVWHGLLHKEGKRRLIIDFMRKGSEQLVCIVKDNGIGIKAAREKKAEHLNGEAQESKGLQIIRERLVLLEKQYHIPTSIVLEDLEENHIITGTRVTIQLPAVYE